MTTDKIGHGYGEVYLPLAAMMTGWPRYALVEIGIGGGDGCRWFADLFPDALVIGVDIDAGRRNPVGPTVTHDATQPGLWDKLSPVTEGAPVGVVVDDGSHLPGAILSAWRQLWPQVAPGGWYVVEDWNHANGIGSAAIGQLAQYVTPDGDIPTGLIHRRGLFVMAKDDGR